MQTLEMQKLSGDKNVFVVVGGFFAKSYLSLATPQNVACHVPLTMGFPRQEYWSGLPFPSLEDLPDPGIEPASPALQVDSLPLNHQGKPKISLGTS